MPLAGYSLGIRAQDSYSTLRLSCVWRLRRSTHQAIHHSGQLWGKLIYAAINAVQQARTAIKDKKLFHRFTSSVIVFSWACKAKLRDARLEDPSQEGSALVARGVLEQAELDEMTLQDGSTWQPYYCLDVMRSVVHEGLCESGHESGDSKWHKEILLDNTISELAQSIGGAIRVKATGMPRGYDTGLKGLVWLYCTVASFAWASSLGWYTPIFTFAIYFILWALLKMGTVLVDPFGVDPVDHPLGAYCATIEQQCKVVQQRQSEALHLPPSEREKMPQALERMAQARRVAFTPLPKRVEVRVSSSTANL